MFITRNLCEISIGIQLYCRSIVVVKRVPSTVPAETNTKYRRLQRYPCKTNQATAAQRDDTAHAVTNKNSMLLLEYRPVNNLCYL